MNKRQYLEGLRCAKNLFLSFYKKELAELNDNSMLAMQIGKDFEDVVRKLIAPQGIDITSYGNKMDDYIQETQSELERHSIVPDEPLILYQATFKSRAEGIVTMTDILIKNKDSVEIIEVKAICELTDLIIYDTAFQYCCLTGAGLNISKFSVAYVNKNYVRGDELTSDLILLKDVTKVVKRLRPRVLKNIQRFQKILKRAEEPDTDIGMHCFANNKCPFWGYCTEYLGPQNIFQIKSMRLEKKMKLHWKGISSIEQLTEGNHKLTDLQRIQIMSALEDKIVIQKPALEAWLKPVLEAEENIFMDFESLGGLPLYEGCKPFQNICFQWSIQCYSRSTKQIHEKHFLADPGKDPRREFIESLIAHISEFDNEAPIIVYNLAFEKTQLKTLAILFPEYEDDIKSIISRLYDLMEVFRKRIYYDKRFEGSYSIKKVFEVICPEPTSGAKSYKFLRINNGVQASLAYHTLGAMSKKEADIVRNDLIRYCSNDTICMLDIIRSLEEVVYPVEF